MAKSKKKAPAKKVPAKKTVTKKKVVKKKVVKKAVVKKAPAKKTAVKKKATKAKPAARKAKKPVAKPKTKKAVVKKTATKTKPAAKKKATSVKKAKVTTKAKSKPAPKAKPAVKKKAKVVTKKTKAPAKKKVAVKTKAKVKSVAPKAKPAPKKAVKAKAPAVAEKAKRTSISMEKPSKKSALRNSLTRKAASKPIAFSLDEVVTIAKKVTTTTKAKKAASKAKAPVVPAKKIITEPLKPAKPSHVKAASLADILGFNPKKPKRSSAPSGKSIPEKFKRYHKLLIELRTHLTEGIELHSEETLKRSAKDDAGDLSSYGQHMADAGTDTFDRDFALSLVSSEQDALSEIEAAINRIYDGTYGICEITGKAIAKERLLAVPFTRHSTEAQKDLERNRHRTRTQAGLFGEHGDDASKLMDVDGDND